MKTVFLVFPQNIVDSKVMPYAFNSKNAAQKYIDHYCSPTYSYTIIEFELLDETEIFCLKDL